MVRRRVERRGVNWLRGALLIASVVGLAGSGLPAVAEETAEQVDTPAVSADGEQTDTSTDKSTDERVDDLETKVDTIADELSRAITAATVPEDRKLESFSGLGPAASKVYFQDRGLSIGGYGELLLREFVTAELDSTGTLQKKDDIFDALRGILYVGYKFNDQWVVNSEFEFEHAGTGGGGSVSIEFMTIDYLPKSYLNFRVGLVLIPMGFINEIHEPVFFYGANRPEVEQRIIPTTWRENGAGIFGQIGDRVQYRMYAVNGLNGGGFTSAGLRGGRQKGSRALVNDWAFVARADVDVITGLMVGGSVYTGNSGQEQVNGTTGLALPEALTTLYELHAQYKRYGLTIRALVTQAFVEDAGQLNVALGNATNNAVASRMLGWYALIAYDVMPLILGDGTQMALEPYFRYELVNTQERMPNGFTANFKYNQDVFVAGVQFKPIYQIVFKLDYQNIRPKSNPDAVADAVRFAAGFVF